MMKEPGFPSFENKETPEKKVARLLREKGVESEEAREALMSWTREQEKGVESSTDPEASILFNLRRAQLYLDAGYNEEALEAFDDAIEHAYQEGREELYQKIVKEAQEMSESLREKEDDEE